MISNSPYWFTRTFLQDTVLIGLDLKSGIKSLEVKGIYENGTSLRDAYSGKTAKVNNGKIEIDTPFSIVLFEKVK